MNLYQGKYNWYGEVHVLWAHARDRFIAHRYFIAKLMKLLSTSNYRIRNYFSGSKDNFNIIKKEKEAAE